MICYIIIPVCFLASYILGVVVGRASVRLDREK